MGLFSIFSFFVQPLVQEFGGGARVVNSGATFILIAPAIVGPLLGKYVDSASIQRIMLLGVAIAMGCLVVVSVSESLPAAGLAFFGYAMGQTLYGPIVANALLVRKYVDTSGRALAIASLGGSLGPVVLPFAAAAALDSLGWRQCLQGIALIVGIFLLASILLGIARDDGRASSPHVQDQKALGGSAMFLKREFWVIGICTAVVFNGGMLISVTYAPHFLSMGYSRPDVALFVATGGVAGLLAKLLLGFVIDGRRQHVRAIAAAVVGVMAAGFLLLSLTQSHALMLVATTLIGGGAGASLPLYPFLNSAYFDPGSLGRVIGAQVPIFVPLSLTAAPLAGYVFDTTGNFAAVFASAAALLVPVMVAFLSLGEPWVRRH